MSSWGFSNILGDITTKIKGIITTEENQQGGETAQSNNNNNKGNALSSWFASNLSIVNNIIAKDEKRVVLLPWEFPSPETMPNYSEEAHNLLRTKINALSSEKKTFLTDPLLRGGEEFAFEVDDFAEISQRLLNEDERLSRSRFLYVPRFVREWRFWRNYYYSISKIFEEYSIDFSKYSPTALKKRSLLLPPPLTSNNDDSNNEKLISKNKQNETQAINNNNNNGSIHYHNHNNEHSFDASQTANNDRIQNADIQNSNNNNKENENEKENDYCKSGGEEGNTFLQNKISGDDDEIVIEYDDDDDIMNFTSEQFADLDDCNF